MDKGDLKAIQGLFRKEFSEELSPIKAELVEIKETLDSHTVSLMNLEKEIKSYMDALDLERKRVDKHDNRLEVIEESLGLEKV